MFCAKCGNMCNDDAKFCPKCGATLKRAFNLNETKPSIKNNINLNCLAIGINEIAVLFGYLFYWNMHCIKEAHLGSISGTTFSEYLSSYSSYLFENYSGVSFASVIGQRNLNVLYLIIMFMLVCEATLTYYAIKKMYNKAVISNCICILYYLFLILYPRSFFSYLEYNVMGHILTILLIIVIIYNVFTIILSLKDNK